jgi:hypothetical protein
VSRFMIGSVTEFAGGNLLFGECNHVG